MAQTNQNSDAHCMVSIGLAYRRRELIAGYLIIVLAAVMVAVGIFLGPAPAILAATGSTVVILTYSYLKSGPQRVFNYWLDEVDDELLREIEESVQSGEKIDDQHMLLLAHSIVSLLREDRQGHAYRT